MSYVLSLGLESGYGGMVMGVWLWGFETKQIDTLR